MNKDSKEQEIKLTVRLPKSIVRMIHAYADGKGMRHKDVILTALARFFDSGEKKTFEAGVVKRLNTIESKQREVRNDIELFASTFELFLQIYFTHAPTIDHSERALANVEGKKRFNQFQKVLEKRIQSGGRWSLTDLARESFVVSEDDFLEQLPQSNESVV